MDITFFFSLLSFIFGTMIGSFLNVVVWRLPRGESLSHPPSHCPRCGGRIRPWENIPILSWLALRGRCRSCQLPISWRYPLGEAATGILFLLIFLRVVLSGWRLEVLLAYFWLSAALLAAALIDARHRFIPNSITYTSCAVAALLALIFPNARLALFLSDNPHAGAMLFQAAIEGLGYFFGGQAWLASPRILALLDCLLGMLAGITLLGVIAAVGARLTHNGDGNQLMGWGDAKLLAMIGAFLGADACIYTVLAGATAGFLSGFCRWLVRGRKNWLRQTLPFGPFLAAAAFLWIMTGNWLFRIWQGSGGR